MAEPYRPAGPARRAWSAAASTGLALVVGAVLATTAAFTLAIIVTTLTNLLKK